MSVTEISKNSPGLSPGFSPGLSSVDFYEAHWEYNFLNFCSARYKWEVWGWEEARLGQDWM